MQHPTLRFLQHEMFESLRRWTGEQAPSEELPIDVTLAQMDEAGVDRGLICAWYDASGFTAAQALKRLDELGLDDEARELFLGGNASRLFPA